VNERSDSALLREYAENFSEGAFTELAQRHVDFVYSAALRMVRDPHLAQDVTQGVFAALAKNASALEDRAVLSGWLHRTAQNIAAQTVRTIERRRAREQEAAKMNALLAGDAEISWTRIAPHLDDALGELSEPDRDAVLLRYFERKSASEMAARLGISNEAAQKRLTRAVERLRQLLMKRGVTVGASALAAALTANAVQAAPIHLAISSAAALSTSTFTNAIAMTTLQKSLVAAVVVLSGAGIYEGRQASQSREQARVVQSEQASLAAEVQQLQREHDDNASQLTALRAENDRLKSNTSELLRLRGEVAALRQNRTVAQEIPVRTRSASAAAGEASEDNIGQELGRAVVRGDPGALDKMVELAKSALADFKKNGAGQNDLQRDELNRHSFAPIRTAFKVIADAALQNNPAAIDALVKALLVPELRAHAAEGLGELAGAGNDDAVDFLLNPNNALQPSTLVSSLRPAATRGNSKAIDTLAAVAKDPKSKALWLMAAEGLSKPASSGNQVAIEALIGLSQSTNRSIRSAVLDGLSGAARNQNAQALQTLQSLGVQ
jgi:RNA polymerase sigma factor (sigma-70 family)